MKIRCFHSRSGLEILAGQDDVANDRLSLREARPDDLWFHVRGQSGSHVVLRRPADGSEPDRDSVREAAAVAAWFSKMRAGGNVAVSMCRAGDLHKPRGAKPGTVSIRREKILKVRPALPVGDEGTGPAE